MKTAPMPVAVERTAGSHLILADGRRVIDGLASWWSACHGYNHPHITQAVADQLQCMPHVMFGGINHKPALSLARRLADILPGDLNHVFFSDSGSVAVEVAMKMAAQYWRNGGESQRNRVVSFTNAYHGDTTGAMSVCDPHRSMHARFDGFLLDQISVDLPQSRQQRQTFESTLRQHRNSIAAVILEPLVQGAGGMKFHDPDIVDQISRQCQRFGLLFIADELATGFGRTGSLFAIDQTGSVPDIMCVGKALTAGTIGMAATIATDRIFDAFYSDDADKALMHGPTFMANPLACAAANASLDLFESEPRIPQAISMERRLTEALAECAGLPGIVDVRCKGAIGVVQVEELYEVDRLRQHFLHDNVWVRPFGDTIYLTPPLNISDADLLQLLTVVVRVVEQWSRWR